MGSIRVTDPHGDTWVVRRRWVQRRLRWRGRRGAADLLDGAELAAAGGDVPIVGVALTALALALGAIAAVLFVVPAVLFLVELLFVALVVVLGVVGRVLLRRPWTIDARRADGDAPALHTWQAVGWRASRQVMRSVAEDIRTTGRPPGAPDRGPAPGRR